MIESSFHGVVGAKSIGSSGDYSSLVVESLGGGVGDFTFGSEPIEDEFLVGAEHGSYLAHGLDAAAQGALAPNIKKGGGPGDGTIAPEVMKGFLEHPGSGGGQLEVKEFVEFLLGAPANTAAAAKQFPAHVFEMGSFGAFAKAAVFSAAHLVKRLIEVRGDVEAIKDMEGVIGLGRDDIEVRPPHVTAHKAQPPDDFRSQSRQTLAKSCLGAPLSHPEKPAAVAVDLVDNGQEVLRAQALAPMDFVDADGFNALEFTMRQAPLDKPIHRAIDSFPTGLECPGGFAPRHAPSPAGEEDHHGDGDRTLSMAPREMLDTDAVGGTVHASRGVEEVRRDTPHGNETPKALRQAIVARCRFQARGAFAVHGRVGFHMDVDF